MAIMEGKIELGLAGVRVRLSQVRVRSLPVRLGTLFVAFILLF